MMLTPPAFSSIRNYFSASDLRIKQNKNARCMHITYYMHSIVDTGLDIWNKPVIEKDICRCSHPI
jgi:hypothetical protein